MRTGIKSNLYVSTENECVGATQEATVWIGNEKVVSFTTATKYEDSSLEIAEEIVARALRPFLIEQAEIDEYARIVGK